MQGPEFKPQDCKKKESIDGEKAYQRVRKREEELFYLDIFKSMAPTV
jgi:hypothetical protein